MPIIIEKGYLYVAQPPLYRVRHGNGKEIYLKNDLLMREYLIDTALSDDTQLSYLDVKIDTKEAKQMCNACYQFLSDIQMLNFPYEILEILALLSHQFDYSSDQVDFAALAEAVKKMFSLLKDCVWNIESSASSLILRKAQYGMEDCHEIFQKDIFSEGFRLAYTKIQNYLPAFLSGLTVKSKHQTQKFYLPSHLLAHLPQLTKSNLKIQRFKGLGEMNSAQLWETTLNPATRTLMRITLNDVVEAEHIFSTLMGEGVEPRRIFIQNNALYVKNLDF